MDDKLLDDVRGRGPGNVRGTKGPQTGSSTGGGQSDDDDGHWPWTKRLRLQRHPSFRSVDEDRATTKSSDAGRSLRSALVYRRRIMMFTDCNADNKNLPAASNRFSSFRSANIKSSSSMQLLSVPARLSTVFSSET